MREMTNVSAYSAAEMARMLVTARAGTLTALQAERDDAVAAFRDALAEAAADPEPMEAILDELARAVALILLRPHGDRRTGRAPGDMVADAMTWLAAFDAALEQP